MVDVVVVGAVVDAAADPVVVVDSTSEVYLKPVAGMVNTETRSSFAGASNVSLDGSAQSFAPLFSQHAHIPLALRYTMSGHVSETK